MWVEILASSYRVAHGPAASNTMFISRHKQIRLFWLEWLNEWVCMLNDKETVRIVRKASGGINDPHPFALSFTALTGLGISAVLYSIPEVKHPFTPYTWRRCGYGCNCCFQLKNIIRNKASGTTQGMCLLNDQEGIDVLSIYQSNVSEYRIKYYQLAKLDHWVPWLCTRCNSW